jgi:hypothetical protein
MVARQVTVDVKGSHLFVISQTSSRRVRKPSLQRQRLLLQHRRISNQRKQPVHDRPQTDQHHKQLQKLR